MSDATVIYWRDIPTQIVVGRGRKATKRALADRFMVAVDKAAMADGAASADDYLDDWRKEQVALPDGDAKAAIEQLASQFETDFPTARLAELAARGGKLSD